jgi:hypothetical protein
MDRRALRYPWSHSLALTGAVSYLSKRWNRREKNELKPHDLEDRLDAYANWVGELRQGHSPPHLPEDTAEPLAKLSQEPLANSSPGGKTSSTSCSRWCIRSSAEILSRMCSSVSSKVLSRSSRGRRKEALAPTPRTIGTRCDILESIVC